MHHDIESVLEDLYAIEPSLRAEEAKLRPLVAELLASKPDARFDERFARELRAKLASSPERVSPFNAIINSLMNLKSPYIPAGVVAVIAVVALVATQQASVPGAPATGGKVAFDNAVRVSAAGERAFGALSMNGATPVAAPEASRPQSGGGGLGAASSVAPMGGGGDAKMAAGMIAPPYEATNYRYVYKGELPAYDASQVVYKRDKGAGLPASAFRGLGLGAIDLNRFGDAKLQSFSLMEDREYGYMITVDGVEGAVSINQNWLKWPNPYNDCRDEACYESLRIKPEQVLSDEEAIAMADRFIADYGIAKGAYGAPIVRNEWRVQYARAVDKTQFYIPEAVSVTYPLMVDGRAVNDDSGYPYGLSVNVNVRHKRVDGVWNLTTNDYVSSSYQAETDAKKIMSIVERGGIWGWQDPNAAKTVDIELGEPELVLIKTWVPRPTGPADELLAPALRFKVLNPPAETPWFRDNVTVPLVKELLDQAQPPVDIMPLVKEAR